jgi:dTDP-4-amino-4,6-dideoxygalactose transaminase
MITKGEYLRELEGRVERLVGARCVAVSSCTVGLVLALQALKVDGEVILPSFTFLASASAPAILGLPLRFVDVEKDTLTIDPSAVRAAIGPRTAAIIAVHTFGNPADVSALEAIARDRGLTLIIDAAHGLGSLRAGQPVGAAGDAEVFSMSPTKLVAAGEGGLITTRHDDVVQRLDALREYGNAGDYVTQQPGLNGRLDEMSAILAIEGFRRLEANAKRRNRLVDIARAELHGAPGVVFQRIRPGDRSSYKDFGIVIEPERFGMDRDDLAAVLREEGVDSRRYYAPLVHRHPAFKSAAAEPMPASEWLETRVLSLPLFSHMPVTTMRTIARLVAAVHRDASRVRTPGRTGAVRVA